jgi:putative flippase GtrA
MVVAEESRQSRVDEALRFLNVVCVGMILSVGVLVIVAWFVSSRQGEAGQVGPPLPAALAYIGFAVGLALLVAAPLVHRKMLARAASSLRADERTDTALESFRLATLLAFILREGAAIVGLMLTLLTNEPMWSYVLSALAIIAMIWGWPKPEQVTDMLGGQAPA